MLAFTRQVRGGGAYVPGAELPAQVAGGLLAVEAPQGSGTIEERRAMAVRKEA